MKRELNKREDISFLIHTFYEKVREDEMLGPIFNSEFAGKEKKTLPATCTEIFSL